MASVDYSFSFKFPDIMDILICDSGSSKAHWYLQAASGNVRLRTQGFNPYRFTDQEALASALQQEVGSIQLFCGQIYFYGAGCAAQASKQKMKQALAQVFPQAEVHVFDDLLGAARGTLASQPGSVFILGTGMNNGFYDGGKIIFQVDSLGYVLGDEGSGVSIGRELLRSVLRGAMPGELMQAFESFMPLSRDEILARVYKQEEARSFIAALVPFAAQWQHHDWMAQMLQRVFAEFAERILKPFGSYAAHPAWVVGGVGWLFREQLKQIFTAYGFLSVQFVAEPMEGLVRYHMQ